MGFLIGIGMIGAVYLICWIANPFLESANKKMDKHLKEQGDRRWSGSGASYQNFLQARYKGGIKNISADGTITINVLDIGLGFTGAFNRKVIKFENIKDIFIENERSIQQQVSLGKLIMFGGLAFGMKKKNVEINKEYVIINVIDEDGEYNVVLDTEKESDIQSLYNKISNYKVRAVSKAK